MYIYTYIYVYTHTYTYIYIYILYICMYVCMYVYIEREILHTYISLYIYIYIYMYTHIKQKRPRPDRGPAARESRPWSGEKKTCSGKSALKRLAYSQLASQDVRPGGPNPWKVSQHYTYQKKVPGPPNPWTNIVHGIIVIRIGCKGGRCGPASLRRSHGCVGSTLAKLSVFEA